eukprot:8644394-Pyramimonas_sp.AAC.1
MQMEQRLSQQDQIKAMMNIIETGAYELAVDHLTDCRDVFELVTGLKGVPQDKQQWLPVMALREERITTKVRWAIHVPTGMM